MPNYLDQLESREWLDALGSVVAFDGPERAGFLLEELIAEARRRGAPVPYSANTPYLNTIPPEKEIPGAAWWHRRPRDLHHDGVRAGAGTITDLYLPRRR